MTANDLEFDIHKRYLLGRLDPETEELDGRLMLGDRALEDQLAIAEDELIDEFVRGDLSPDDRGKFRQHFLDLERRRRKVVFAEVLHEHVARSSKATAAAKTLRRRTDRKPKPDLGGWLSWLWDWSPLPAWSYALVGLLVMAVLGGLWAWTGKLQLEEEIASLRQMDASGASSSPVATVWLSPGLLRGVGEVERLIISEDSILVRVQLDIGVDDYGSYRAALHDASGDEYWTQSKLTALSAGDKVAVTLNLPSDVLPHGDYYVRLSGVSSSGDLELVGRYYFRVLEQARR